MLIELVIRDSEEIFQVLGGLPWGAHWVHVKYRDENNVPHVGHRVYEGRTVDGRYLFRQKISSQSVPLTAIEELCVSPIIVPPVDGLPIITPVTLIMPPLGF